MSGFAGINREPLKKFKGAIRGVLMCILTECNYSDNPDFKFNSKTFPLKRGQFITSLNNIHELTGCSIQQIRTALKKLESFNVITNPATKQLTNQARLITLINPDLFLYKKETVTNLATNQLTNLESETENSEMLTNQLTNPATDQLTNPATDLQNSESLVNNDLKAGEKNDLTNLTTDPLTNQATNLLTTNKKNITKKNINKELKEKNKTKKENLKSDFEKIYRLYIKPKEIQIIPYDKLETSFRNCLESLGSIEALESKIKDYLAYLKIATWRDKKAFSAWINNAEFYADDWKTAKIEAEKKGKNQNGDNERDKKRKERIQYLESKLSTQNSEVL